MGIAATIAVEVQLTPGVWTDITADTNGVAGLHFKYGIPGNGPLDCVAGSGDCSFELRNDRSNSGATQGYYSPLHASRRPGWTFGIPVRVQITQGTTRTKFRGKIAVIDPDPGQYLSQRVRVTAYDVIRDLAEAEARSVAIQVNKTETQLVSAVLDSLPAASQPVARDFDAGIDTFPYAFDDLGSGVPALAAISDAMASAYAMFFVKGDGTACVRSRATRAASASAYTFNNTMHGLEVPSALDKVFDRVRVTIHGKVVSAAATDELYTLPAGTTINMAAGETRDVWTDYTDPVDRQTQIGGTAVVTALIAGTHYSANAAADGSGADLTASVGVTISPFASTAKWTIVNNAVSGGSPIPVFILLLKAVGKAVRDPGPQSYEASSVETYPTRILDIDLKYQANAQIAQSYAAYVQGQFKALATLGASSLAFIANDSAANMAQALDREPGDVITVTEPVTGLVLLEAVIQSVEFDVSSGPWIVCRWGLAPAAPFKSWVLGTVGRSEAGTTTILGF